MTDTPTPESGISESGISETQNSKENISTLSLFDAEKQHILRTLDKLDGNKLLTARHLKIATTTLYRKLRQYGLM